jgi:hypothetical protein
MRRLLKEIVATGEVTSDVTALEDHTALEKLKALVKALPKLGCVTLRTTRALTP